MKHIICHSGGHSSALAALKVARRFGTQDMVLLNHNMHFTVEAPDIKRFKQEVADYLGIPITFANRRNAEQDQFDVCVEAKAFKVRNGVELCTARLKTEPFNAWLKALEGDKDCVIYYGFDDTPRERARIQRRTSVMGAMGYRTDYPVALWSDCSLQSTEEVGIQRPSTYEVFQHGNCIGCLKAGWQHWYIVFCTRPDIWLKGKWAEEEIGYAIHHDDFGRPVFLEDMEPRFEAMRAAGVPATERVQSQTWWAAARKVVRIHQAETALPCECST